jgi:hypothetical protein
MDLRMDEDVQVVAEFMQRTVPASKLISVADDLSKVARLLWSCYPQEPSLGLVLVEPKKDQEHLSQSDAI